VRRAALLFAAALLAAPASADTDAARFASERGVKPVPAPGGKSFYLLWRPAGASPYPRPGLIVALHGGTGTAFGEFRRWQPLAEERGLGLLVLEWRVSAPGAPAVFLEPSEIRAVLGEILRGSGAKPESVMIAASGRGAASSYALAALDRRSEAPYLALFFVQSGPMAEDFPPNLPLLAGQWDGEAFAGTHWIMTCAGSLEPEEGSDSDCARMRRTSDWVRERGGTVELFLELGPEEAAGAAVPHADEVLDLFAVLLAAA
jgi:hypothetical protein